MSFQKKVCVITGGAHGIGRCMVEEFLAAGAKVAFVDVNAAEGQALADRFPSGQVLFWAGDITEEAVLNAFTEAVVGRFGQVDVLINNACVSRAGIRSECSFEDFNYVLRLGVTAPYMLTRLFLPYFTAGAAVVNISSTRAGMSQADTESYSAAKGGIEALTHALAVSLAGKVRVNAIRPGWIETGEGAHSPADNAQHPVGRVGVPQDIVRTAMFLCSEDASFITGETVTVDGGMSRLMIYHNDYGWSYEPKESE